MKAKSKKVMGSASYAKRPKPAAPKTRKAKPVPIEKKRATLVAAKTVKTKAPEAKPKAKTPAQTRAVAGPKPVMGLTIARVSAILRHGGSRERDYKAVLLCATLAGADLTQADLSRAFLKRADLRGANLRAADLRLSAFIATNLDGAHLTATRVYGISVWGPQGIPADQADLVITSDDEAAVTVDNLKVAQFIHLLLANEEVRAVIDTITSKVVLILGRFAEGRKVVLNALRDELRSRGLSPILFDFDVPRDRDITETVTLLARMSRFVIADLTDPRSIPQEIQAIAPDVTVPIQAVILSGQEPWTMFKDLRRKYHWVLEPYQYRDQQHLLATLDKVAPSRG